MRMSAWLRGAISPRRLVLGLAVVLLGDGVFDAVADDWVRADLEHLGFPTHLRRIFPVIKLASATGLVAGLARPRLGRLTATALIAFFVLALGFHTRAKDGPARHAPALGMLAWSVAARRAYDDVR